MNRDSLTESCGIFSQLAAGAYTVKFRGFNAIDRYMGLSPLPFTWVETSADIAVLAQFIDNIRFPGVDIADAAADHFTIDSYPASNYFICIEDEQLNAALPLLSFTYNWQSGHFEDPLSVYSILNELKKKREHYINQDSLLPNETKHIEMNFIPTGAGLYRTIMDAALLLARYGYSESNLDPLLENCCADQLPEAEAQRAFLINLLVSPRPDWGLELIKKYGLLEKMWPELASYDDVDHAKEFHPEGNVWMHTLETFRHRKAPASGIYDLRLSLGLLLHDAGKPIADSSRSHRFDGHAELGARAAGHFLKQLGFGESLIEEIYYLVRNHMLPAALKRLPLSKTADIMSSKLFPTLMELYRCDESSSFKGLDSYYENSAVYQTFQKNTRNPYRTLDGKRLSTGKTTKSYKKN